MVSETDAPLKFTRRRGLGAPRTRKSPCGCLFGIPKGLKETRTPVTRYGAALAERGFRLK